MIRKINTRVISSLLIMILFITNILPIANSFAINNNDIGTEVDLVCIGEVPFHLKNVNMAGEEYVVTDLVGYYDNGNFYPAYCVNNYLPGVDKTREYSVTLTEIMGNNETYNKVWRVVTNGYPYKSAEELGVSDWIYAFQATKMAIYCVLGQSNLEDFYATDAQGQEVVNLIRRLVDKGNNGTETYRTPVANINKTGALTLNGDYYIQNYSVSANVNISSYEIITRDFPTGTKITNTSGIEKSDFNVGESFQVRIPKNKIGEGNINGTIRATVTAKTYAVFYATNFDPSLQDYSVTGDPLALTSSTTNLKINGNTAAIKLKKVDIDTNKPVSNTTFELSKSDGTVIEVKTTGNDGVVVFNNLYKDNYIVKETKSNDEYILNKENIYVSTNYNETIEKTLTNKHKEGKLSIYKVDKDNHEITLGNVEFDLYSEELKKVVGTYKTNVNGEIHIDNLRTGNYKIIEKNTGKWYNLADDTNVKVEWNKTTKATIENELKKGQIKVIKVDLDDNNIKLKDVEFQIKDKNGNILETIKTNDKGEALSKKYSIRDYEKLIITEIKTNKCYKLNPEPQTANIKEDKITDITFINEKKKGQVKVIKEDLDNKEIKIPNVEFEVYDEKGNVVDTLITNEKGEAVSKKLPIDQKYKIKETKTDKWYKLNTEPQTFNLKEDEITDITFTNEKKKGQIKVIKEDLNDSKIKLKDVEFKVYDEKGKVVDTLITDEKGEATTRELPIDQKYIIQETKTLQNYVLNNNKETVNITQDKITNVIYKNEKVKGKVEITKVSKDDNKITKEIKGTKLAKAVFEIYTENNELVDTITTKKDGKATSKLLEYGKYYVLEKNTGSDYYLLNTKKYEFEIKEHNQIIPLTIENKSVEIGLDIDKNGILQAQPNDEIKYSFNSLKNTSNVHLNNFTWTDNLPYDYIRITKLFTGTYNEDLDYIVKYKTNKTKDYKEYGKYNTQKNNYIDFTKIKLAEGEFITDYKIEFGTVKPGFEAVEKPFIFAKVLPTVKADDKWTNNTSLTGNYKDKELEDKAEWTTISYAKKLEIKKLPRTGF